MEYSVEELARAAEVSVDTVRYYQSRGLLPGPTRRGRRAVYGGEHLDRLRLVRQMGRRGLSLKVIAMLLERGDTDPTDRALLTAIEEESDAPSYSREELARQLGVPPALLASVEQTGLAEGQDDARGRTLYSESDLRAARGALKLLGYGFPLTRLLALAVKHDRSVRRTVDEAIDLFDDFVRKRSKKGGEEDPDAVANAFKELLPVVTALIAHHFQRVLVNRALGRLRKSGEKEPLEVALRVAARSRVGVRWQ